MKNQLLKLRKGEGFISIETIIVAAVVVLAGIIAYNTLYAGTLEEKANLTISGFRDASAPINETLFTMEYDGLDG
jgi:hypothetical protein